MKNKKSKWHKFNYADLILVIIAVATLAFVNRVFEIIEVTGVEPSALVTAFFAFITSECAILWRQHEGSKNRKLKREEREGKEEDDDYEPISPDSTYDDGIEFTDINSGGCG